MIRLALTLSFALCMSEAKATAQDSLQPAPLQAGDTCILSVKRIMDCRARELRDWGWYYKERPEGTYLRMEYPHSLFLHRYEGHDDLIDADGVFLRADGTPVCVKGRPVEDLTANRTLAFAIHEDELRAKLLPEVKKAFDTQFLQRIYVRFDTRQIEKRFITHSFQDFYDKVMADKRIKRITFKSDQSASYTKREEFLFDTGTTKGKGFGWIAYDAVFGYFDPFSRLMTRKWYVCGLLREYWQDYMKDIEEQYSVPDEEYDKRIYQYYLEDPCLHLINYTLPFRKELFRDALLWAMRNDYKANAYDVRKEGRDQLMAIEKLLGLPETGGALICTPADEPQPDGVLMPMIDGTPLNAYSKACDDAASLWITQRARENDITLEIDNVHKIDDLSLLVTVKACGLPAKRGYLLRLNPNAQPFAAMERENWQVFAVNVPDEILDIKGPSSLKKGEPYVAPLTL